jgi:hypothetical protein
VSNEGGDSDSIDQEDILDKIQKKTNKKELQRSLEVKA